MTKKNTILLLVLTLMLLVPKTAAASTLYFVPESSIKTNINDQIALELRLDSEGEAVNTIGVTLDYSSDILSLLKIDYQSSAFSMQAKEKLASGKMKIIRANVTPQTGDLLVAKLTFRAVKSGRAKVSINPESAIPTGPEDKNSLNLTKSKGVEIEVADPDAPGKILLVGGMFSGALMSFAGIFILFKRKHSPKIGSETTQAS